MKNIHTLLTVAVTITLFSPCAWAGEGSSGPGKFIFSFLNFAIFGYLFYRFGLPKMLGFFSKRGSDVQEGIQQADVQKKKAQTSHDELDQKLKKISVEMENIMKEARTYGQRLREEFVAQAKQRADVLLAEGHLMIERETKEATDHLKKRVVEMSAELAEGKIKKMLGKKEHEKLLDGCIRQLEAM